MPRRNQTENPSATNDLNAAGLVSGLLDFSFQHFITIRVVKLLYILVLASIALEWLLGAVSVFTQPVLDGFSALLAFVFLCLLVVVQTIFARIALELVVVLFRIGENTTTIAQRGDPESKVS